VGTQRVLQLTQCLKWYLDNPYLPPLPEDVRALLERWLEHPDAEKIWNTIRAHSELHVGPISMDVPVVFILSILHWKNAAERESEINAKIAADVAEVKKSEGELRRKLVQSIKEVPLHKMPEFLEEAGKRLRKRLQGYPSPVISLPRVRSDKSGSRARTYFIREVSGLIHDTTGKWLDEQVAMITATAFNTDVSSDAVRKARLE
jgi:hypothetical protein